MATMSLESAQRVYGLTEGFRKKVLLPTAQNDPIEFQSWIEAEIAILGKTEEPSRDVLLTVEKYMHYWQACDVLVKIHAKELEERKTKLANLLKEFEEMKQAR